MASFAKMSVVTQLESSDEIWASVLQTLSEQKHPTEVIGPNSTGANVFLCSEDSSKIVLHEVMAREFTNLFDPFDFQTEENLRDPFGNYVFIFHQDDLSAWSL